jgi:hypothetical protein
MSQPPSAAQHAAADGGGFVDEPPRCASAIQLVRPLQSKAETQPQLQPDLLSLSAMISQYFTASPLAILRAVQFSPALPTRPSAPNRCGSFGSGVFFAAEEKTRTFHVVTWSSGGKSV